MISLKDIGEYDYIICLMRIQKIVWVMILGLILRVLTAAYAYHTDTKAIYRETLAANQNMTEAYHSFFEAGHPMNYPPIVYKTLGTYYKIAKPLFSGYFSDWMNDWGAKSTINHPHLFRDMLAMKFPYLLAELGIIYLLVKLIPTKNRNLLLGFWMLNPLVIWSIYVPGNFDIFPALLTVLGLYSWKRDWKTLCYVLIGIAAGFKLYPLLLIPVLFVIDERSISRRLLDTLLSFMAFGISFLPVVKDTWVIKFVLGTNLSASLFKASIDLGVGAQIPIFLTLYFGLLIWMWYQKKKLQPEAVFTMVLLVLLAFTRFHQQWIIWVLPFLSILAVENILDPYLLPLLGMAYFGSILLINDKFTNFGLLKGVNNAFDTIEPLRGYVDKLGIGSSVYPAFLALFLATSLYLCWKIIVPALKHMGFDDFYHKYLRPWAASLIIIPLMIFLGSHVLLTKYGKYIDIENKGSDSSITLDKATVVKQLFTVESNNFSAIEISLKNVDLRSKDDIHWQIERVDKQVKAEGVVNAAVIGDDFDTTIYFPIIADSKNKDFTLTLTSPAAVKGKEIQVPYLASSESARLKINNIPVGNLSYTTYFNPGGYLNNLKYTLTTMISKW